MICNFLSSSSIYLYKSLASSTDMVIALLLLSTFAYPGKHIIESISNVITRHINFLLNFILQFLQHFISLPAFLFDLFPCFVGLFFPCIQLFRHNTESTCKARKSCFLYPRDCHNCSCSHYKHDNEQYGVFVNPVLHFTYNLLSRVEEGKTTPPHL